MKKTACFVMSIVLLLIAFMPAVSVAAETTCSCEYTPVVYIKGRTNIYKNNDDEAGGLAERNISGGEEAVKESAVNISAAFARAIIANKWDEYCDVLYDEISPVYDQYALNEDGEIDNDSGISHYWEIENTVNRVYANGKNYHINRKDDITLYQFQYDCRIDPCATAADLNRLIKAVIDVTGHKKVKLVARCQGTVIANAYFNIFGHNDVEEVLMYNSIASGAEIADSVFSGNAVFDSDAMNRFLNEFLDTSPVLDFIKASVDLAALNGTLAATTGMVQLVYNKIAPNLMPRIIKATFGQCPGWYGMISPDRIDECKNFVLGDNADGKFDKLIQKIDNYNDNYKIHARSVLEDMQADGVNVYIIAKYNNQMYPVVESPDQLGDGVVSVWKQTYEGATCADVMKTLDKDYIAAADEKYISPDRVIDASTGLFPDHTWYLKDLAHDYYPNAFDAYLFKILRYKGYTDVNTLEDVPQWLRFIGNENEDLDRFEPLTEENLSAGKEWPETSFFRSVLEFFKKIYTLLTYLFQQKKAGA